MPRTRRINPCSTVWFGHLVCTERFLQGDPIAPSWTTPPKSKVSHDYLAEDDACGSLALLYRASRDGWEPKDFHVRCDNQGPTISIGKTTQGYIFGGYADVSWQLSETKFINSPEAFVFALKSWSGPSPMKSRLKSGQERCALYHGTSYGPTFGGGHDLAFLSQKYSNMGNITYSLPPGATGASCLTGTRNLTLSELEVFHVDKSSSRQYRPAAPGKSEHVDSLKAMTLDKLPEKIRGKLREEQGCLIDAFHK